MKVSYAPGDKVRLKPDGDPTDWCSPTRQELKNLEEGLVIEEVDDSNPAVQILFFNPEECPYVLPADIFDKV
jgi:hypothetical protein